MPHKPTNFDEYYRVHRIAENHSRLMNQAYSPYLQSIYSQYYQTYKASGFDTIQTLLNDINRRQLLSQPFLPEFSSDTISESFISTYNSVQDQLKHFENLVDNPDNDSEDKWKTEIKNAVSLIVNPLMVIIQDNRSRAEYAEKGNRLALKIAIAALACTGVGALAAIISTVYTVLAYYQ